MGLTWYAILTPYGENGELNEKLMYLGKVEHWEGGMAYYFICNILRDYLTVKIFTEHQVEPWKWNKEDQLDIYELYEELYGDED